MEDDRTEVEDDDSGAGKTKREGQGPKAQVGPLLERGDTVGRYIVIELLGQGGMGVVYAAYDPELDRRIAIKLLQAKPAGDSATKGQAWLLREAQALARLSHPNVIAVHDVGLLSTDRVFVAMELVAGVTLRAWLKARPRTWREVQTVMLAAGAGLAAAHAAGLVHRDFKPENVLVGDDGRVRVMDFGLARLTDDEATPASRNSDLSIEARSPLSESLTVEGSVLGTPSYMAPELFQGLPAGMRTDQFSFGVALYEALYRTRPFTKKQLVAAATEPPHPKDPPAEVRVPAAFHRLVSRAISIDPERRFPSIDALLAELAVDPGSQRRSAVYVLTGLATIAVLVGAVRLATRSHADEPCSGIDHRLAGAWDAATKQTLEAAYAKSKRPFARAAFGAVERTLTAYAGTWTDAVTESCRATQRAEQPADVQALRQDCFDQRLEELRAFTQLLANADDANIEKAGDGALHLEPVDRCANIAMLRAPTQPTPENRAKIEGVRAKLAEAKAGMLVGNFGRAINASTEAVAAAHAIPFDPIEAEARFVLGMALINVGNATDAATTLAAGVWAGLRGQRDDIAALAALHAALTVSEGLTKDGEARIWIELGRAAAARAGGDRGLEAKLLETEGVVAGNRGDLVTARAAHEKALALAEQIYGKDGMLVARNHQLLGATLSRASEYALALPHYEKALAMIEGYSGATHPDVALLLSGAATCYHYTNAIAKAHAAFDRALQIREKVFGATSPVLIPTLNNYAELLRDEGEAAKGLPFVERARALTEASVGRNHPYFVVVTATQGELLALAGRRDDARATLDESLAVATKVKSPYLPEAQLSRAQLAVEEQQWDLATTLAEAAIAGLEAKAGADAADLWKPLTSLALAKIATGKPAQARPLLERAIAVGEKSKLAASYLVPTRAALAALPAVER